jgi:hypothetical protein
MREGRWEDTTFDCGCRTGDEQRLVETCETYQRLFKEWRALEDRIGGQWNPAKVQAGRAFHGHPWDGIHYCSACSRWTLDEREVASVRLPELGDNGEVGAVCRECWERIGREKGWIGAIPQVVGESTYVRLKLVEPSPPLAWDEGD